MSVVSDYFFKKGVKKTFALGRIILKKAQAHLHDGLSHKEKISTPIVLHHCGTAKSLYQVRMWLPVIEQLGNDVVIVVRKLHGLELEDETNIPVLYIPKAGDISNLVSAPDVKVVLYTANTGNNIHLVRDLDIKHVFIGHGDSDKLSSAHNLFKMYDHSFVAGDAHIDRFKRNNITLPDNYFFKVGRPNVAIQMADMQVGDGSPKKKTVLYAPTWEGAHSDSSYSSVVVMMESLLEQLVAIDLDVIVRLHPFTGTVNKAFSAKVEELKQKYQENSSVVFDSASDIYMQMSRSDLLISDVSSVISDYLYFNKPIYITNPYKEEDFEEAFPIAKCCNVIHGKDVKYFFSNNDPVDNRYKERQEYRQYVMGECPENAFDEFKLALYSLTGK
ncbi:CDP-glycerol glycerophosphotransferase family protein [Vibrio sp. 10N.222.54.B12]|uniref:CDP-glycerol glycerophosphotransferase family protein n=1 Tax=unclassified Vibrio TaxID=2614977 RepID=UPI0010BD304F|nr:CDP-glycerol glycerophosphotransferase family protein [Vibrio sp. F13]TKF54508.1 hypothetical protein FCV60_09365 [Vibrio sp. F13]